METKKFIQNGTFPIIIFGIPLFLFCLKSYDVGFFETLGLIYVGLSALMLGCILFMYKMVIEIDENQISFKFGVGLFKRTYPINELISCSSVRSSLLSGFGIRKIANGWLYNISGLDAIELRFIDKKNGIRIGTNGSYFMGQLKGYFKLKNAGSAYLNLNRKNPPFIRIILKNDEYLFLNLCDAKETIKLFKNIENKTSKKHE